MKEGLSHIHTTLFSVLGTAIGTLHAKQINLTPEEWDDLFEEANNQEVLALAFDGVNKSKNNLSLAQKTRWGFLCASLKKRSRLQLQTLYALKDMLLSAGIPLMLLKGYGFARFYPNPSLRQSNDIDIYTMGHYEEAQDLFRSFGMKMHHSDAKHCGFSFNGIEVENHIKMNYDDLNHANCVLGREFAEKFDLNPEVDPSLEGILFPEKNMSALHMMMHTISHLAWSGVSLRHLTDWTLFLAHNYDSLDFDYLDSVWKDAGLAHVVAILTGICREFLGCSYSIPGYDSLYSEKDYIYVLNDILNPVAISSLTDNVFKKLVIKTSRHFRRCRKHKIIYGEPFPDSYLKDIGLFK